MVIPSNPKINHINTASKAPESYGAEYATDFLFLKINFMVIRYHNSTHIMACKTKIVES